MKIRSIVILTAALYAGPIRAQAPSAAPAAATLPSVTLPADLDRVLRDYETAWRANDIPALVALFTDDGFVLQPGKQPARGHAALTSVYTGQAGGMLRLRALAFASEGSLGYIIGAYGYGDAPGDQGKFTLTLRKVGGRWLIASDMDNGSQARRPMAAPSQ
jgi:ketosteroid isomerase-like protein